MAVSLIGYSDREMRVYHETPEIGKIIDQVVQMMQDLGKEMDVLFTLIDEEAEDQFSLAFSDTTLALDFCPHKIAVTDYDFDEGDILTIAQFDIDQINAATLCLINEIPASQAKLRS